VVDLGMSLKNYLRNNDVWYRFIRKPETIHTADAAKAAGLDLSRLTKNLVSVTSYSAGKQESPFEEGSFNPQR